MKTLEIIETVNAILEEEQKKKGFLDEIDIIAALKTMQIELQKGAL